MTLFPLGLALLDPLDLIYRQARTARLAICLFYTIIRSGSRGIVTGVELERELARERLESEQSFRRPSKSRHFSSVWGSFVFMNKKITIYTDGAASGNPGKAGWGVVFLMEDKIWELGGGSKHATNNQMELTAGIEALKYLKKEKINMPVEIFSDSKYMILGITEWIHNWIKNNWRSASKKPVLNRELWQELHELNQELKPKWIYVEGHNGDKWNDRADEIAVSFGYGEPVELKKH